MIYRNEELFGSISGEPGTVVVVAIASTSTASAAALTAGTVYRCTATAACHITFGATPTASTSSMYVPADETFYLRMTNAYKVATIRASSDGNLYLTPMTPYGIN